MQWEGKTVISQKMLGVVMGWSDEPDCEEYLDVLVYDTDLADYKHRLMRPQNLMRVTDPLVLKLTNRIDTVARRLYILECLDLALATYDEEWFRELSEEWDKIESETIRLGSIVSDRRRQHVGIVVSGPSPESDYIELVCWSTRMKNYMPFDKKLELVEPVIDPNILKDLINEPNRQDREWRDWMRGVGSELALQTNDRKWFDELNQKETSDGS